MSISNGRPGHQLAWIHKGATTIVRPTDANGNPSAVIWDMDGTLVDTANLHYEAWLNLAAQLQKPFSRENFAATFGRRNPEIIQELFGTRFDQTQIAELGDRKERLYRAAAEQGVTLLPGASRLIQEVHEAGIRQAIGSSAPRANLDLILRLTGIAQYFQAVVSMEDTERGKPDPQVFQLAATRLGVAPGQCLVMEDAVAGVLAAKAGGMKCIAIEFGGQHTGARLKDAGADLVVKSLDQVSLAHIHQLLHHAPRREAAKAEGDSSRQSS